MAALFLLALTPIAGADTEEPGDPPQSAPSNVAPSNVDPSTGEPATGDSSKGEPPEDAAATAAPAPGGDDLERAKRLFEKGLALQKAGDCERAVVFFLRSRALVASVPNTLNAANCLTELGRYDESLELLELLLTELRDELRAEERAWIGPEMARLRKQVGGLEVVADSDAEIVVDGRRRGTLPLIAPLRVLPGKREVRVLKSGFRPFVAEVEIAAGETTTLRATLEPLTVAGRLRVEGPAGAEVFVDGAPVGTLPWEGVLAPGRHLVQVRQGDEGSAPGEARVVTGQTVTHAPTLTPLGAELSLAVEPREATLTLDGIVLGTGRWRGRLPVGRHRVEADAEGYLGDAQHFEVTIEDRPREIALKLAIDEAHPRWSKAPEGRVIVEVLGGPAFAPSLGSGAEERCESIPCALGLAHGFLVGARGGYELPFGLSFEVLGGYAAIERSVTREIADSFTIRDPASEVATRYSLASQLEISGGFVGAGLGFRQPLGAIFELGAHLAVGAWFNATRDHIEGTVEAGASREAVGVVGSGASERAVDVFVAPEVRIGARIDGFGFGVGLTAAVMALDGPATPLGDVYPRGACDPDGDPAAAACAPGEPLVTGERGYGPFVLLVPGASASYAF